ncbi:MAG: type II toxin-antitoxin system VapC family toxin [Candidatus Heimdallarchaeota archaeon]
MLIYLDSSAILKRYLEEAGSDTADKIFDRTQAGSFEIGFNIINTGEVLGIFDKHERRGSLSPSAKQKALEKYFGEMMRLLDLRTLTVHPCSFSVIIRSWDLVLRHQIYIVDALQIVSAQQMKADVFLSGDKKLIDAALAENLIAFNIESEEEKIALRIHG